MGGSIFKTIVDPLSIIGTVFSAITGATGNGSTPAPAPAPQQANVSTNLGKSVDMKGATNEEDKKKASKLQKKRLGTRGLQIPTTATGAIPMAGAATTGAIPMAGAATTGVQI